jgi:pimeloyl-ACP methyl ester carboxylesterase
LTAAARLVLTGACGLLLLTAGVARADSVLAGHWQGAFSRLGSIQEVALDLVAHGSKLSGTFDIPALGCYDVPLEALSASDSTMSFELLYGTFHMILHPADFEMTGENRDWGPPVSLHLGRAPRPSFYDTVAVSASRAGATIRGTLYLPHARARVPAVVVAGGSIQSSRAPWEYRSWGPVLAQRGIAVLIYDRRGHGASSGDTSDVDLKVEAADVVALVAKLRQNAAIDPARVGVMGLSRGGWVASWAAASSPAVRFLALECAPAVSATEQEIQRVSHTAPEDSLTASDIDRATAFTRIVMQVARGTAPWSEAQRASQSARQERWRGIVQIPEKESDLAWWRRNDFDEAAVLRRVHVPVYAAFGGADRIVPPGENLEPMRQALAQGGNRRVQITLVPGVGHGLYRYGRLTGHGWKWPSAYWVWSAKAPGVFENLGDWILAL